MVKGTQAMTSPETIWAFPLPSIIDNLNLTTATMIAHEKIHWGGAQYARKDLYDAAVARAEQAEALVAELEGALQSIDALDPEASRIKGCGENALRGLVLRMGGIARAALSREGAKFWLEVRLWKLLRWLSPDDGRPCNTDQFLTVLLAECDDHYDRLEAIKAWLEGDWAEACDGLSIELKEPKP
jgi:hypothetical protein